MCVKAAQSSSLSEGQSVGREACQPCEGEIINTLHELGAVDSSEEGTAAEVISARLQVVPQASHQIGYHGFRIRTLINFSDAGVSELR